MTSLEKYHTAKTNFLCNLQPIYNIKFHGVMNQTGGAYKEKEEEHIFIDIGGPYTFRCFTREDNNAVDISILSKDEKDCGMIYISKKDKLAILTNLTYYENCAKEGLRRPGGGDILLKFSLNLIVWHKYKHNIKRILLTDNSYLPCKNSESIKLARLRTVLKGNPWYVKYGFKPYDPDKNKPSKELLNELKENAIKIKKIKTQDIDITGLIKKSNLTVNITEINKLLQKYLLVKDFIIRLLDDFDTNCSIVELLLTEVFKPSKFTKNKVPLYDFHKTQFYLDI